MLLILLLTISTSLMRPIRKHSFPSPILEKGMEEEIRVGLINVEVII